MVINSLTLFPVTSNFTFMLNKSEFTILPLINYILSFLSLSCFFFIWNVHRLSPPLPLPPEKFLFVIPHQAKKQALLWKLPDPLFFYIDLSITCFFVLLSNSFTFIGMLLIL